MSFSQIYFVLLLFVAYLGNVILISSYFPQQSSPKNLDYFTDTSSQFRDCNPQNIDENLVTIPSEISPNEAGIKDELIIPITEKWDSDTPNELIIFDQYSQEVYQAPSYQKDRSSTYQWTKSTLAEGKYFYKFELKNFPAKEARFIELRR